MTRFKMLFTNSLKIIEQNVFRRLPKIGGGFGGVLRITFVSKKEES